jgi:hypothetical protein
MEKWQSLIERQLEQLRNEGGLTNLPGEGKPLKWDDDAHTPADLQMAHKILKDNDMAPDWIMAGREVEGKREELLDSLRRAVESYQQGQAADPLLRRRAQEIWESKQQKFRAMAESLNKQITSYNLKVPPGIAHKPHVNLEREMKRLLAGG